MYKFVVDDYDIPFQVFIETEGESPQKMPGFVEAASAYAKEHDRTSDVYYYVMPSGGGGWRSETRPKDIHHAFFCEVELKADTLQDAIEEGICLTRKLNVHCFKLLHNTSRVCIVYEHQGWRILTLNMNYKEKINIIKEGSANL